MHADTIFKLRPAMKLQVSQTATDQSGLRRFG